MLPQWTVPNNHKLAELEENINASVDLPLATLEGITTSLISGSLPLGLRLENNRIIGTPFEVNRPTTSTFVIRATTNQGIADRTFFILVEGADDPVWITEPGRLPIGSNGVFFILDNSLIDFQLLATDPDLPAGDSLEFRLTGGELPPGITLTKDGRLTGIVDPLLALDINVVDGSYDRNPIDVLPYDFSAGLEPGSRTPRKLNREYFFRITVYDNVSAVTRQFQIFVVGDDFARADNTIMKAADGVFTADFTFLRVPLWLTPSNLGIRRANNYLTIFLDAFDANTLVGELQYFLEPINDDGSASVLPPGLQLDPTTGEIAGRVPYQPAVTRDYKFTINALRFNVELGLFTVFGTYVEDTLANKTATLKIAKVPRTLSNGLTELQRLVGRTLSIENKQYDVISVNETDPDFDTITFDRVIEPLNGISPLVRKKPASAGQDFFFVNTVTQVDRNFYFRKFLRYSDTEVFRIDDVYPYIEWEITSGSNDPVFLIGADDSTSTEDQLISMFSSPLRAAYINVETNSFNEEIKITMRIPATAQNRNKSYIESLFESADSGPADVLLVDEFDRVKLDQSIFGDLNNDLSFGIPIALSVVRGGSFNKTLSGIEEEAASKKKTFNIRLLGEIDSVITWLTPGNLGTLPANRISTLFVRAQTTVQDSLIRYNIVSGNLPPGLTLSQDGEIIGKVPVVGGVLKGEVDVDEDLDTDIENPTEGDFYIVKDTGDRFFWNGFDWVKQENVPGLLRFFGSTSEDLDLDEDPSASRSSYDGERIGPTTFDFGNTTFDREFNFTVLARDRFEYSAIERRFTIRISDEDNLNYSNIFIKPFLKTDQRQRFVNLVDNARIFPPGVIYRPNDPSFGVQKTLKCLVYAGIENLDLESYVAAAAKNHRRKNFYFGELKTAVARRLGTNETVYEVVYVELVDREKTNTDKVKITSKNKITADSVSYETKDDLSVFDAEIIGVNVLINSEIEIDYFLLGNAIETNENGNLTLDSDSLIVVLNSSEVLVISGESIDSLIDANLLPDRYRPTPVANTIKADTDAITIDQNTDNTKYLSNIDTMRQRIKNIESDDRRAVSNREFLPLWMRTAQEDSLNELDYVLALPIAYTKPGQSQTIKENIENSNFNFKELNFDIDRYIIDNTKDTNREQYILFANYQFNV